MPSFDYSLVTDLSRALSEEYDDTSSILHTQLSLCATPSSSLQTLRRACSLLSSPDRDESGLVAVVSSLSILLQDAYEGMSTTKEPCWRYLYTEASILRSLASLLSDAWAEAVVQLDRAIIIAGPAGVGRHDFVLSLIAKTQERAFEPQVPAELELARSSATESNASSPRLPSAENEVPVCDPPSLMAFRDKASSSPFILRGYAKDWPALNERPWNSLDYLRRVAGSSRIVPVEVGSDYREEGWSQMIMPWEDFLECLTKATQSGTEQTLYMAQHSLFRQFPSLEDDIAIPDYVYADLDPPASFPDYSPPQNDQQLVISSWLGPKGTITPAHTDPFFNLYTQVVGMKTVWLAPPECFAQMASVSQSPLANTSSVDVFSQELAQHPEFWESVPPKAMCATLYPGDMLYFPPGWWHAMRADDVSYSVSMWF